MGTRGRPHRAPRVPVPKLGNGKGSRGVFWKGKPSPETVSTLDSCPCQAQSGPMTQAG